MDRLLIEAGIAPSQITLTREGDSLIVELEKDDGFVIDRVRIEDHFLGRGTGIEEIAFADGTVWDRDDIFQRYRNDRFNAVDDLVRWADEDMPFHITASQLWVIKS